MSDVLGFLGELLLLALCLPVVCWTLYLGFLAILSWPLKPVDPIKDPQLRFDVVVPAHDEALSIANTVKSLLAMDYPKEFFRVVVVADNCTDDTADRAREAGAIVVERTNPRLRGKGYALAYGFRRCLSEGAEAVVVVDADTTVSKNLLQAFAARLAAGEVAVQAHYGVANPDASWRTRLMRIALSMFHQVRSVARERLELSAGLRGNGMCFRGWVLREVPHEAFSLVEDLEYGIRLGRRGYRVAYAPEAQVLGEMVSGEKASRSQRHRWEQGRAAMLKLYGWPLLRDALLQRSALLMDLAMDVLVPPLSRVVMLTIIGAVGSAALFQLAGYGAVTSTAFGFSLGALGLYVVAGWLHSGTGLKGLVDLGLAPAYVAWKVMLSIRGSANRADWIRTTREGETRT